MEATSDPRAPRQRRPRIEDVAQAAHVSVATVSRALRGLPNVAESTRSRVLEVATAMHYEPDPAAARLAAGRTRTVIIVVPHLASWYFSTVIAGAEAVCNESGYEFLVVGVGTVAECDRLLDEPYRIERRTDGVILVNIQATDAQARSFTNAVWRCRPSAPVPPGRHRSSSTTRQSVDSPQQRSPNSGTDESV